LPAMPHDLASRLNQPPAHVLHLGALASVSGRRAASRTGRGAMIGGPPRGFALATFLPARRPAGKFARARAGFFILSRDGGLELFKLFNRSRRSSSAIRAVVAAIPAACAANSAINSSLDGSPGASRILRLLDPKRSPPSRKSPPRQAGSRPPNLLSY
jgi:hypothetical protein